MAHYVFKGSAGGTARYVTDDKSGAKLPKPYPGTKWILERTVDLAPGATGTVGAPHDEALAGIAKDGYYKF